MEALTATEWKEFRMGTHLNLGQLSWLRKAMHESHAPGDAQEKSHLADGLLLGRCCKRDARPHTVDAISRVRRVLVFWKQEDAL